MYPIFSSWLFYFMAIHLAALVFLCVKNFKFLYQSVRKIEKSAWLLLFLIFIFSFYLRNSEYWLGPFSDGYVAQESARMWILNGDYVKSCALGNPYDCEISEQVLFPAGYPFIIVLAHLVFGIHSLNASVISGILASLTTIIVFLITFFISKKENAGLYAALIFSFIPFNILYSQSGETRPAGLFFEALAILFFFVATKKNKMINWLGLAASLSYAIYIRQESYILVPILLLFFAIFKWKEIKNISKDIVNKYVYENKIYFNSLIWKIIFVFLLFFILQIPVLKWMLFNNPYQSYQGGGFFALHYKGILAQGHALFLQLFNMVPRELGARNIFHYNIFSSVLFLFSVAVFFIIPRKKTFLILSVWVGYYIVYSLMFDGNINGTGRLTGDYFRRSTMLHASYAIIGGIGFCLLSPFKKKIYAVSNILLLFFILLFSNYPYFKIKDERGTPISFYFPFKIFEDARTTKQNVFPGNEYWQAMKNVPNGCLVIAGPYLVATNDYFKEKNLRTVSLDFMNETKDSFFLEVFKENQCIYYFEDYRCSGYLYDHGCKFIYKHLDKNFVFQEGGMKIYSVNIK